jgi:hypothetical protein
LAVSQRRVGRSLMRFSWLYGAQAPAGAIRVLRASCVRRMGRRLRCAAGRGGYDTAPSLTRQGMRPLMKANNPRSTPARHRPRWLRKDEDLAFEFSERCRGVILWRYTAASTMARWRYRSGRRPCVVAEHVSSSRRSSRLSPSRSRSLYRSAGTSIGKILSRRGGRLIPRMTPTDAV